MAIKAWIESIHGMDHQGSLHLVVEMENGHKFEVRPWWEGSGETGTDFQCSCGFFTRDARASVPELDAHHGDLLRQGVEKASWLKVGTPGEHESLLALTVHHVRRLNFRFADETVVWTEGVRATDYDCDLMPMLGYRNARGEGGAGSFHAKRLARIYQAVLTGASVEEEPIEEWESMEDYPLK